VAFTVTAADLMNFATYCKQQSDDIGMAVKSLNTLVEELCSAPYEGPASVQLLNDMVHVGIEALVLSGRMDDIIANLQSNAHIYANGETQNVTNLQAAVAAIAAGNAAAAHG